ncbi:hypothetical protein LMG3441_05984 [Achromobacter kerstersii]|uniref:Uncharacterized protein n=1 Tax=Achromobacter kerstersii TaxID=1353890 RepID=A0A6S7B0N3_9BURK|nr:hypothetical protein LMG3441_05984 [Achromobacter kerstersii]
MSCDGALYTHLAHVQCKLSKMILRRGSEVTEGIGAHTPGGSLEGHVVAILESR